MSIYLLVFFILNLSTKTLEAVNRFKEERRMILTSVQGQCKYYRPKCLARQKKVRKFLAGLVFQWGPDCLSNTIFYSLPPHVPHSNLLALLLFLKESKHTLAPLHLYHSSLYLEHSSSIYLPGLPLNLIQVTE